MAKATINWCHSVTIKLSNTDFINWALSRLYLPYQSYVVGSRFYLLMCFETQGNVTSHIALRDLDLQLEKRDWVKIIELVWSLHLCLARFRQRPFILDKFVNVSRYLLKTGHRSELPRFTCKKRIGFT